jgi:hypothetical protein
MQGFAKFALTPLFAQALGKVAFGDELLRVINEVVRVHLSAHIALALSDLLELLVKLSDAVHCVRRATGGRALLVVLLGSIINIFNTVSVDCRCGVVSCGTYEVL